MIKQANLAKKWRLHITVSVDLLKLLSLIQSNLWSILYSSFCRKRNHLKIGLRSQISKVLFKISLFYSRPLTYHSYTVHTWCVCHQNIMTNWRPPVTKSINDFYENVFYLLPSVLRCHNIEYQLVWGCRVTGGMSDTK